MPGSLDKFRDLKYNKPEEFITLQIERDCAVFQAKVRDGKVPLNVHKGKQDKHRIGSNNYVQGKSFISESDTEIQRAIYKYAGIGQLEKRKIERGEFCEYINISELTGYVVNLEGKTLKTHRFCIHYSKKGVHLVPTLKELE